MGTNNGLGAFVNLLCDNNCLKILYYLERFNPNVPIEEISKNLDIELDTTKKCVQRLINAKLVLQESHGGYSLTSYCRNTFKELFDIKSR